MDCVDELDGLTEIRLVGSIDSMDWIDGFDGCDGCDGGSMDGPRPLSRLGLDRWVTIFNESIDCSVLNPESLELVRCSPESRNSEVLLNSAARFE